MNLLFRSKVSARAVAVLIVITCAATTTGCGIAKPLRQRRGDVEHSGFLRDYSQLAPRQGFEAKEVYVNPDSAWETYDAVHIESATLWISDPAKQPSKQDEQMLTDLVYRSLSTTLGERFRLVSQPGPGVLEVRVALTEAKGARVALNSVTTVVPQLRLISSAGGLAADTAVLVGAASGEAEINDSMTKERLAAAIDSVAGTKGITRAFSKWADVENACNAWSERLRDFLSKQGVRPKAA
jgi:hypothetical protein